MSEAEPNTDNVVYIDERRKARWLRQLKNARLLGGIATFNFENKEQAKIIPFPQRSEDDPNGTA